MKARAVFPAGRFLACGYPDGAWGSPALGSFEEATRG